VVCSRCNARSDLAGFNIVDATVIDRPVGTSEKGLDSVLGHFALGEHCLDEGDLVPGQSWLLRHCHSAFFIDH
jgi:hypothetical protein